ncbi:MAG: polyribonucleotide nucleotidyltransferase [Chloroflexi bacterium]|nr:polyribonucleotide nucleotidyltransferase [Chloroflexota bacterium]MBT7081637.1 polyribonucleotide nucleotidyltransferase [Chloroflexota bacterium]
MTDSVQGVFGDRDLIIETGRLAEQADGAVVVTYGETVVLVTACAKDPREGIDFFPLTIDYEERQYAAGKIPGGYFKREGRPTQDAILTMRLTDRPLRPLFPDGYHNDVQVIITVLSADQENDPDILAGIGASAALGISSIPFTNLISTTRVGYIDGKYVINPMYSQLADSELDIIIAGTENAVVMVEAGAKEVSEDMLVEAIKLGQETNQQIINLQKELISKCNVTKKDFVVKEADVALEAAVADAIGDGLDKVFAVNDRYEQRDVMNELKSSVVEKTGESYDKRSVLDAIESKWKNYVRAKILKEQQRPDGRNMTQVRPLSCDVGLMPRPHGSGLFKRGATQVLTLTTLGSQSEEQRLDGLGPEERKRFIHHYNFPPFSVGEVKRMTGPGRREIGHGALAERALLPVIPGEDEFPYTIRLVSEVLSSNGSSSMASVCGSTLSLMDAGVPVKAPVAGIAMGLIKGDSGEYAILTDISGTEDHLGDMDFKVAGTAKGVTALQMDIKVLGINEQIMAEALTQAKDARMFILNKITETISEARPELSKYAPRMYKLKIDPEKIGMVIGPKGKTIRAIIEETKTTIDIGDDGSVVIGSSDGEAADKAIKMIENLTKEVKVGEIYTGKVVRIMNFGAFVELIPGKDGMVHISQLADYRVANVEDVVKVGDEIEVKVMEIDNMGRVNLSRRALLQTGGETTGDASGPGNRSGGSGSQRPGDKRPPQNRR